MDAPSLVRSLADTLSLSSLLHEVAALTPFEIVDHWQQGEFHHDTIIRLERGDVRVIVVATNCNGGVKEVLAFDEVPHRWALWHWRCPDVADFCGDLARIVARATTTHWFDPCSLLAEDARSELREEHRVRQRGGGWTAG